MFWIYILKRLPTYMCSWAIIASVVIHYPLLSWQFFTTLIGSALILVPLMKLSWYAAVKDYDNNATIEDIK